jgi:predicted nucleotidyltransferase
MILSRSDKIIAMSSSPPRPPDLPDPPQGTGPPGPAIEFYGGYQVYSESGVDLTLLRENLKRSVTQLWKNNCRALPRLQEVDRSRRRAGGGSGLDGTEFPMLEIEKILRLLATHRVEFVVIGGLAMIAQGSAYLTQDIDLCYSRSPQNIAALADACASTHPYLRGAPPGLPFRFDAPTIQAGLNFTLTTDLGDIDFLGEVSGIGTYEKVLALSEEKEVYGLRVRVLSLDGLIAAKKAANRTKDKLHLLELEELKKMRQASG